MIFRSGGLQQIEFIQTHNSGGGPRIFLTGTAKLQAASGEEVEPEEPEEE